MTGVSEDKTRYQVRAGFDAFGRGYVEGAELAHDDLVKAWLPPDARDDKLRELVLAGKLAVVLPATIGTRVLP